MPAQTIQMLEPGQQLRDGALLASDDELPYEVLRALQDWKAGMIDPWADGFFGEDEATAAKSRSRRRKAS